MTTKPAYVPDAEDLRGFNTFNAASQAALRAGKTVTAGDGRKFQMVDGHATVVGSDSYTRAMGVREESHESPAVEQREPSTPTDPRPPAPGGTSGGEGPLPAEVQALQDALGVPLSTTKPPGTNAGSYVINGVAYWPQTDQQQQSENGPGFTGAQQALAAAESDPYMSAASKAQAYADYKSGAYNTYNTHRQPGDPIFGGSASGSADPTLAGLDSGQRNAYQTLMGMFGQFGLDTLGPDILKMIQQGYDSTSISYMLQQTQAYKARFAANDSRVKNGLAPLAPAEYLTTERAYRQALQASGLPASYYDNHADFTDYIAKDISPAEIKTRADDAMQFVNNSDPQYIQAFQRYYGAGPGEIAAYMLDGQRNTALLSKQITSSQIGAAATYQGLADPGRLQVEKYADMGVTQSQAQQGFQNVAAVLPADQQIASRFGQSYTQQDAQDEFLGGLASAQRKRQALNKDEEGLFAGSSGVSPAALGIPTAGSY